MSSEGTEDYFDIPEDRELRSSEFKPVWTSAEAHLRPQNQDQVEFLATNSRFSQANPRDKASSKLLKAMEQASANAHMDDMQSELPHNGHRNIEEQGLDAWNPMVEDYTSKIFNSYREPSIEDLKKAFPGGPSQQSMYSSFQNEGGVRLFVGRIPPEMTQCIMEKALFFHSFSNFEYGKGSYCIGKVWKKFCSLDPKICTNQLQEGLHNLFSQVGKLTFCRLVKQQHKDSNIGFVGFETIRKAETAIQKFDGFDLGQGVRLKVALAQTRQKPTLADLDELEPKVNGVTCNGVQDSDDKGPSESTDERSIQDTLLPSAKSTVTVSGKPCSFCGQLGYKWCSVCKIPYCSRECQKNDWPKHKLVCPRKSAAESKTSKPETCQEFETSLATSPANTLQPTTHIQEQKDSPLALSGDPVQPSTHTQEHTDSPKVTPGDSARIPEAGVANSNLGDLDTKASSDSEGEMDPMKIDGFHVTNPEFFAKALGFDISQVQFGEKKQSEDSDDTDKSSSCSLDNSQPQDISPKVPIPPSEGPSQQPLPTQQSCNSAPGIDQLRPAEAATCSKGLRRFFIKQLSMESVSESLFEVSVTEVENPSCVWAQLCTPEALERHDQLKKKLQACYCNSTYENYVPTGGEVCVAQFSFDSCWYRAKVDIVNNTGTLRVTYIDFGNHEDITVDKVRRITEDLAMIPRQALKLSLNGITSTDVSGSWSSEATAFVKSKVLGMNCKVQVCRRYNELLFVNVFDPKETNSDTAINDSLMEAGFAKRRERIPSSPSGHKPLNVSSLYENKSGAPSNMQRQHNGPKPVFNNGQRRSFQQSNNLYEPQNATHQLRSPPRQSDHNRIPKERQDSPMNSTGQSTRKSPFEVVVNAVVSPWEFYAQKTDSQLLDKLNALMRNLNQQMTTTSYAPESAASLRPGQMCAARFSMDNRWYRAVILEKNPGSFRIRYADFGNSEVVGEGVIRPLPQQFQGFPPLSLQCSLAGVKKPKGQDWSPDAIREFKTLVANKQYMCRIVHTHDVVNIVELLDPHQNWNQTVANSLITSGLADAFIRKDGTKHQLDGKRGTEIPEPQRQGAPGAPVLKSPRDEQPRKSPLNSVSSPSSNDGAAPRSQIESAVFEPAVQAAALPQDGRFDVLITEVVSPELIYCQNASVESVTKNARLIQDMNEHYSAVSYAPFVAHENVFCAAHFSQSGDWCRAFIKGTSPDGSAYVHYVDYGNTEFVSPDRLRPLLDQFNFSAVPFAALRCSLANVTPPGSAGWSDESMAFVKTHLPENSRCSARIVGRRRGRLFVDVTLSGTGDSVGKELVKQGLAKTLGREDNRNQQSTDNLSRHQITVNPVTSPPRDRPERHNLDLLESFVYQPAIQSASLPQNESYFDVMVTEVTSFGIFFVQVLDRDLAQKLMNLSEHMNMFYGPSVPTSYQPQPKQLCAALYSESGDWCRAFIKGITPDNLVDVHYVDFGNTEQLPLSSIRPLEEQFTSAPFFALPCSLANIAKPDPPGWSVQAMELIKKNVLVDRVAIKVLDKHPGMLFVDFIMSRDSPLSLSQLLLNEGSAQSLGRSDPRMDHQRQHSQHSAPASRHSTSSTSSRKPDGNLESRVFDPAIQSIAVSDSFDAMITHVSSPSSIFVQVLSHDMVQMMTQLSADLNAHYNAASYPHIQAKANRMCAGFFSESGDWCRGFIDLVNPDHSVHVHYLDYGNSEVLPFTHVRPLEKQFLQVPPMALKCSLSGILPAHPNGWSVDAQEAILSQAPQNSRVHARVVKKERGLLFVDVSLPQSQESLGQFLIRQGLARPNLPFDGSYSGNQGDQPLHSAPADPTDDTRVYASAVRLADVPHGTSCKVLISEFHRPDKMYFQVLNEENVEGLVELWEKLAAHCSTIDTTPYKPVKGELCCAQFSKDQGWYRAVVQEEVSESKMMVVFVDYGNEDVVAVDFIRKIIPSFTHLPIQARECFLSGVQPTSGSNWSTDVVNFLKERLTSQPEPQPFFIIVDSTERDGFSFGVQLFETDPSEQQGISINQEMIQRNFAKSFDNVTAQWTGPGIDQFDVVVTDVIHPGEIWGQVLDAEARTSLNVLMDQINEYCMTASVPTSAPQPGQECCAQFSQDGRWYRARVLECPSPGQVGVQYVDFGNSELLSTDRIRPMKDEFSRLPAQALKLSLANIRPIHQVWNQEAVRWLGYILNRELKARVVHRLSDYLVVTLTDGAVDIGEELVRQGYAVKS